MVIGNAIDYELKQFSDEGLYHHFYSNGAKYHSVCFEKLNSISKTTRHDYYQISTRILWSEEAVKFVILNNSKLQKHISHETA